MGYLLVEVEVEWSRVTRVHGFWIWKTKDE